MARARDSSSSSSSSEEATTDEEYVVEKIIGKRTKNGKVQYNIKWEGYPSSQSTWEGLENLRCPILIEEYEQKHSGSSTKQANGLSPRQASPKSLKKSPTFLKRRGQRTKNNSSAKKSARASRKHRAEMPQGSSQAPKENWEHLVDKIVTIDSKENGLLLVNIRWQDGTFSDELLEEAHLHCPQSMLAYYQSRLRFRPRDDSN